MSASTKAFLEIDLSRVLWDLRLPQNVFMLRFVIYLAKDHIVIKLICRQVYLLLQEVVLSHPTAIKTLSPGRVVIVENGVFSNVPGVVLQTSMGPNNVRTFSTLIICNKNGSTTDSGETTSSQGLHVAPVTARNLFIPETVCWHKLLECNATNINIITNKTIKVDADKILKDIKKREQPRFK